MTLTLFIHPFHLSRNINFFGVFSMEQTKTACYGRQGRIVDVAFDLLLPSVLYGATESGDILVFNTRENLVEDHTSYPLLRKLSSRTGGWVLTQEHEKRCPCLACVQRQPSVSGLQMGLINSLAASPSHLPSLRG